MNNNYTLVFLDDELNILNALTRTFFALTMQGNEAPNGPGEYLVVEGGDFENGIWFEAGRYEDDVLVERYGVFEGVVYIDEWQRSDSASLQTKIVGRFDVMLYQRELDSDAWTVDGCRDHAAASWAIDFSD